MITDAETNFVYFSHLLPKRFPKLFDELSGLLNNAGVGVDLIPGTEDKADRPRLMGLLLAQFHSPTFSSVSSSGPAQSLVSFHKVARAARPCIRASRLSAPHRTRQGAASGFSRFPSKR